MSVKRVGGFVARRFPREYTGYLAGLVSIAGTPDSPASRKIHIFTHESAGLFPLPTAKGWAWSSPDGGYRFDRLDPALRYGIIAYDHTGQYDPVIKLNLIPTVD